jgi:hypothetical protein
MSQAIRDKQMNEITTIAPRLHEPMGIGLMPQNMDDAVRLAKLMAAARALPEHLQGDIGTCFMIVEQAMRWRMSPFAVAQCTSSIKGKLMYEGKLVAAAVETSGVIEGHLDYQFTGEGDNRTVTVSAKRRGENAPRIIPIKLADVRTGNEWWKKQPDQQLVYSGARAWARRWTPAVMLGVYSPEEFGRDVNKEIDKFDGKTIDGEAGTDDAEVAETVGTDKPIATPPPASTPAATPPNGNGHRRTLRNVLDAIKIEVKDANTEEELDSLARTDDYRKVQADAPDWAKKEITDAVTARLSDIRRDVAEQFGESGWAPDAPIENDPTLGGVIPDELATPPDTLAQQVAECIRSLDDARTLQALNKYADSLTVTGLMVAADRAKRPELARSIVEAADARRAVLRAGGG